MLPRQNRLNLKKERFLKGEGDFFCPYFKLIVIRGKSSGPKVGFIVSRKVGKATVRNRVRRVFSEIMTKNLNLIPKDSFLIFIAFPKSAKASHQEIDKSIREGLSKMQMRKGV